MFNKLNFKSFCNIKLARKAKIKHMGYPCIPVWMKRNEKDPFDYPLRSRKEIKFDQEISPPNFPITWIRKEYEEPKKMANISVAKADTRNQEVKFQLDINDMALGPIQKKRLIFLLGNRYKPTNNGKFKVVVKQYLTLDRNLQKALDILQQLYWECKRAPSFIYDKMTPMQRRRWKIKLLGKTKEIRQQKMVELQKEYEKDKADYEKLYEDEKNLTIEAYEERINRKYGNNDGKDSQDDKSVERELTEEEIKANMVKEFHKNSLKERVLTEKAKKMFYPETNINKI